MNKLRNGTKIIYRLSNFTQTIGASRDRPSLVERKEDTKTGDTISPKYGYKERQLPQ